MRLKWALHSATLADIGWDEELELWQRFDWPAVELCYDKVKACLNAGRTCQRLAKQMSAAGVQPIGIDCGVVRTVSEGHDPDAERDELARRMDVAIALGAPALDIVIQGKVGEDLVAEYTGLETKLSAAAGMAGERRLRLNLEFLGGAPINGTLASGIELVNRVNHPALGLLFDLCHYHVSASHLEDLRALPAAKLFLVHVADAVNQPLETLRPEQRTFPGEGRIDVAYLLDWLRQVQGYDGYLSVELAASPVEEMDPEEALADVARSVQALDEGAWWPETTAAPAANTGEETPADDRPPSPQAP